MAEVGTAFLTIIPSARGFGSKLSAMMGPEMDAAGRTAGTKFGSSFTSAGESQIKALGGIAKWAGVAVAGLGVLGVKAGLETAASMENAKIAFTTMLGSAQKANVFIKDLGAFAAKTPFEFPELQTAASSLISAGINANKVIPIMTTLGDVTSGMGTGSEGIKRATVALQQMNAAGRITGEDLNQLRDAGIPVYDLLAKATGKSKAEVVKLAQAGKLGKTELDQMMAGLESGKGLEKFKGLMAKQSASLGGIWSTFKDNLNMSLSKALAPSLPGLKDGLSAVSAALPGLISGFVSVITPMVKLGKWIVDNKPVLFGLAAGILTAFVPAMIAAAVATWAWTVALLANPLTWIVVGIALLVAAIVLVVQHWDLIKAKTIAVWNSIKSFLVKLWDGLKSKMAAAWDAIKDAVVSKAQALLAFVKTLPMKILNLYLFLPRKFLEIGGDIVQGLWDGMKNLWGKVSKWITDKIEGLSKAAKKVLGISSPSRVFMEIGAFMAEGLALGIDSGQSEVLSSLRGLTTGRSGTIHASVGAPQASPGPTSFHLKSGALRIVDGQAYIEGVVSALAFDAGMAATA